jgi:hypothetical protein
MKKRKSKRDPNWEMPTGDLIEVPNFLPPPSELAKAKVLVKVTLALDLDTFKFFKKEARKYNTKYQRMIRQVLDRYTERYRAA